jgi:hypothetical protein
LVAELRDHDLVVIGYSGRDKSLMDALYNAYAGESVARLFWCGYGDRVPQEVTALLEKTRSNGHEAFYVPSQGFDDLIERVCFRVLTEGDLQKAKDILAASATSAPSIAPFVGGSELPTSLAKKLDLSFPDDLKPRKWLSEMMGSDPGTAVTVTSGAFALAPLADMNRRFAATLKSAPVSVPISLEDLECDTALISLMRRALVRSVAALAIWTRMAVALGSAVRMPQSHMASFPTPFTKRSHFASRSLKESCSSC